MRLERSGHYSELQIGQLNAFISGGIVLGALQGGLVGVVGDLITFS